MRFLGLGIALMALAACQPPLVSGGADSGVRALAVGMPLSEVRRILGPETATAQSPDSPSEKCVSWVYDETLDARFIHGYFVNDTLATANDRHAAPCAFP